MRFTLDETQQDVVRVAREAMRRAAPTGAAAEAPRGWPELRDAGVLGLAVPTWLGGDGFGALEVMLALAELGRHAEHVPAYPTLALGVLPIVAWGTERQQSELLAGLTEKPSTVDGAEAAEPPVLTAALREPTDPAPRVPRTVAGPDGTVTGTKIGVPYAEQARRILVPVGLAGGGTAVALIDPHAPGVTLRRTPNSTGTPEYSLRLDRAVADGLLGEGPDGCDVAVAGVYELAAAGACALGGGAVAGALALTTAHLARRHQFGRPLATFQAVAQQVADVYVTARTLELSALSAGWRLGTARPAATEVDVAAYWLAAEAPAAVRTCHHLHGGLGLDVSYPLHRYSARVGDLVRSVGGAEYRLERLEDAACSST